jgi:hypothetical protein
VRLSIFSVRFSARLRRRYTRLDRLAKTVALPSPP